MENNIVNFYDIYSKDENTFIARFSNIEEAKKTAIWLNKNYGNNCCVIKIIHAPISKVSAFNKPGILFNDCNDFVNYVGRANHTQEKKVSKPAKNIEKHTYVKYNNRWWLIDPLSSHCNATLTDALSGIVVKNVDVSKVIKNKNNVAKVGDIRDLNWNDTVLVNYNNCQTGWVAPSGLFFGCEPKNFPLLYQVVLDKEINGKYSAKNFLGVNANAIKNKLREHGWIEITFDEQQQLLTKLGSIENHKLELVGVDVNDNLNCKIIAPTDAQIKRLECMGINVQLLKMIKVQLKSNPEQYLNPKKLIPITNKIAKVFNASNNKNPEEDMLSF